MPWWAKPHRGRDCIDIAEDDRISDEAWLLTHVVMIIVDVFDASPSSFSSILGSNPTIATDLVSYLWCFPCSKYDYSDDKLCWSQVVHSLFWNQWPSRDGHYNVTEWHFCPVLWYFLYIQVARLMKTLVIKFNDLEQIPALFYELILNIKFCPCLLKK